MRERLLSLRSDIRRRTEAVKKKLNEPLAPDDDESARELCLQQESSLQ